MLAMSLTLANPWACVGKTDAPGTTGDASAQGGSGGNSGDAGHGGQGGFAGRAGWGGMGGTAGTVDSNVVCAPGRDAGLVTDPDASPPATFQCGSFLCLAGSEYCAHARINGVTLAGPSCRPLPNGCSTCECMKADALSCVFAAIAWSCEKQMECLDSTSQPPATGPTVFCEQA
jgi:hypothetical protein